MKTVAKHSLLGLACVVLLGTCPAVAQRVDMTAQAIPEPPVVRTVQFAAEQLPTPQPEPKIASQPERLDGGGSIELSPDYGQEFSGEGFVGLHGGAYGDCETGPCCAVCGAGRDCPPRFYVDQGTRILTRSRARDELLTAEFITGVGFVPKMNVQSMNFDVAAGYTFTMGRYLGRDAENRDHFWEFTYFGLNEWSETFSVHAEDGFLYSQFPTTTGGFSQIDRNTQSYQSNLHNFELNVRIRPRGQPDRLVLQLNGRWRRECQVGRQMSYLFGIRGVVINEKYDFMGIGEGARDGIFGDYDIMTHNDLVGLQVGGDMIFRHCRWDWGMRAKAGPHINFCDQTSDILTNDTRPGFFNLSTSRFAKKDEVALVAEFGFVGNYKLRPNLNVRAAYDFIWISGLALGSEQLDFAVDPPPRINDNGSIYFHGLSLSAELIW